MMGNFTIASAESEKFMEWLPITNPELAGFGNNTDIALVKGRKMTINSLYGINFKARQALIELLKQ